MPKVGPLWWLLAISTALSEPKVDALEAFSVVQALRGTQLHLFAPVSVNGSKSMWFGVDTGAPISLISPALRRALSLPTTNTADLEFLKVRNSKTPLAFAQSVKSMSMELGPGYFAELPIAPGMSGEGTIGTRSQFDMKGLIGMNFLLKHGALINCRTQQIFFSRNNTKLPVTREGYEKWGFTYVPIRITPHGYVEVVGTIAGSPYSFIVDTGAFWTILEPAILKRTHTSHYLSGRTVIGPYAGIKDRLMFGKGLSLKFETQDMSDLVLGFAETGRTNHYEVTHEYGGLIGADLLWKRHAIIDLGNRGLYLMPDKKR